MGRIKTYQSCNSPDILVLSLTNSSCYRNQFQLSPEIKIRQCIMLIVYSIKSLILSSIHNVAVYIAKDF